MGMDDETQLAAAMANSISIATPKLSLSKLGIPPPNSKGCSCSCMQTPPLLPSVSIPFRWEEAPGKPRPTAAATPKSKSKTVRCLELPPRLQLHEPVNMMPSLSLSLSPTTVLDEGPYVGRSLSLACTFSFRKAGIMSLPLPLPLQGGNKTTTNFGSGRFRDDEADSIDFSSHSLRDFFTTEDIINNNTNNNNNSKTKKKTRRCVKRRRSFFTFSTINTSKYFLGDIYASLKQAVPWRRQVRS